MWDSRRGRIARALVAHAGDIPANVREVSSSTPPSDGLTASDGGGDDACPPPASARMRIVMQRWKQAVEQVDAQMNVAGPSNALQDTCGAECKIPWCWAGPVSEQAGGDHESVTHVGVQWVGVESQVPVLGASGWGTRDGSLC